MDDQSLLGEKHLGLLGAEPPGVGSAVDTPHASLSPSSRRASSEDPPKISSALLLGSYSCFASMYMLVSFVAPFFPQQAKRWHIPESYVGFICACDAIGEVLSTAFATLVMAKLGAAKAGVLGMVGNGISSLLFGLAPMLTENRSFLLTAFISTRLANGALTNITYIAVMAVLCNLMPDKTGTVTSNVAVLTTIGLTIGPPFGGALFTAGDQLSRYLELGPEVAFAAPFAGATLVLLAPTWILWNARHVSDAAEAAAASGDGGEADEDISLTEELKRMGSVINSTTLTCILAIIVTSIGQDARDPILGPHLSSRCKDDNVLPGEHFPFNYTPLQISLVFSSGSIAFLPLSIFIGAQADARERDFAWLRRSMALGLGCEAVAFALMGPSSILPINLMRRLETSSCLVLSQVILGVSNALTLIAAFPFIEGACEKLSGSALTQPQRIAVAGTWYNGAFSLGCAMGPLLTGWLQGFFPFADTLNVLALVSLVAMVIVIIEGSTDKKATAGFLNQSSHNDWFELGEKFREWALNNDDRVSSKLNPVSSPTSSIGLDSDGNTSQRVIYTSRSARQSPAVFRGSANSLGSDGSLGSPLSSGIQSQRNLSLRMALVNEIIAEETAAQHQSISIAYKLLLYTVYAICGCCLIGAIVQGDKEPCRLFYNEPSSLYGCSNPRTIGLFRDGYHASNCNYFSNASKYWQSMDVNRTHMTAHGADFSDLAWTANLSFYPHPANRPTGCVLVRTKLDANCTLGQTKPERYVDGACLC